LKGNSNAIGIVLFLVEAQVLLCFGCLSVALAGRIFSNLGVKADACMLLC
jgi:hypothetical protein